MSEKYILSGYTTSISKLSLMVYSFRASVKPIMQATCYSLGYHRLLETWHAIVWFFQLSLFDILPSAIKPEQHSRSTAKKEAGLISSEEVRRASALHFYTIGSERDTISPESYKFVVVEKGVM